MSLSNKGFLLIDALLSVFIVSCICILCFSIYQLDQRYEEGLETYYENSNIAYEAIFNSLAECEACTIDESD